jgi:hypothetical protein
MFRRKKKSSPSSWMNKPSMKKEEAGDKLKTETCSSETSEFL